MLARLPQGGLLPLDAWRARHRSVIVLLGLHAAVIPIYATIRGFPVGHVVLESSVVPLIALAASLPQLSQRIQTLLGSLGLLVCSGLLVHLSGGLIEMHFHYFVVIVVISLYQDWLPFLAAIAFVVLHHGIVGAIDPESVFNHMAAINAPWRWSAIHALFIGGIVAACLTTWRLDERHLQDAVSAQGDLLAEVRLIERLNEAGAALVSDLDPDRVLQRAVDLATDLAAAESGAFVHETRTVLGEPCLLAVRSGSRPAIEVPPVVGDGWLMAGARRSDGSVRSPDLGGSGAGPDERAALAALLGVSPLRSVLAVSVKAREEETGVLILGHSWSNRFSKSSERAAVAVADRAGAAIDNARLYNSQRTAAATLQQALLPERLPDVAGLSFASRYLPGGPDYDVGGDWYDVFPLPDGLVGLAMGDVVGRGLSAAVLMGQLRDALRAYALEGYTPQVALDRLNRVACALGLGYVATVVFVALDPVAGTARIANAGHLPVLHVDDDGRSRFVRCDAGIPLGVLDTAEYCESVVELAPGSSLVLYTDGLVEDRTTSLDEGMERLRRAAGTRTDDPDEMCARVLEHCATATATPSDDDTALLVVRRGLPTQLSATTASPPAITVSHG